VKIIKSLNMIICFTVVLVLLSLTACVCIATASNLDIKTFLANHENNIKQSTQVLIVIDNNSSFPNQRKVYAFEKKSGEWKAAFEPFDAVIGKNGFAEAGKKREGDGKTPSGAFSLHMTFGYEKSINTKMPYRQALVDDIWVDDPKADDYNRWVKKTATQATSYERMRRDDDLYKYGIVIEYNTNPVVKGHGSAIFFHVWPGKDIPTAGCVAVSEKDIVKILAWLDPKALPVIIMGKDSIPDGFVDIQKVIPEALLDIRYYGPHNFLGEKVDGYMAPKCLLTRQAADALAQVQKELAPFSLSLKIYDCYRPQRAVNHFVRWAKDINSSKTKKEFYPTVDKRNLFKDGYIDSKSGHSRGSTVDLTIVPFPAPRQQDFIPGQKLSECYLPAAKRFRDNTIDMGTGFDCFHELSHTLNNNIGNQQKINRLLLISLMEKHGFRNYDKEWWHYTLNNEPYPNTYFDFVIE
jgi:D-alanyl-D-alanine dipeptidase